MKSVVSLQRSIRRNHFIWKENRPLKRFELFRRIRYRKFEYTGLFRDIPPEKKKEKPVINNPVTVKKEYTWYQKIFRFIILKVFMYKKNQKCGTLSEQTQTNVTKI
jgi:hypothetical protein